MRRASGPSVVVFAVAAALFANGARVGAQATPTRGQASQRVPAAAGAQPRQLWQPAPGPGLAVDGRPGLLVLVRFDQLIQAAEAGGEIELPLINGVTARAAVTRSRQEGTETFVAGPLVGGQEGEVSLTSVGDTLAGRVVVNGRVFVIRRVPDSPLHVVTEVEPQSLPPEAPPIVRPGAGGATAAAPRAETGASDTNAFVDLMVLYTPAARTAIGGTSQMVAELTAAVNNANLALANANVVHRFRLAHNEEIAYSETGDVLLSLTRLQGNGDGFMDSVHTLRNQYSADVVTLLTTDANACGIGYLMDSSSVNSSFASFAFNVVNWTCANANLSLAHEIGHNMGLEHDRPNAGGTPPSFPYAYGYYKDGVARDVMSYATPCLPTCPRLAIFSTPLFNFPGTSTPAGTATEDNARALNGTSLVVANFRQSTCTYTLSSTSASVGPGGGPGTVGVTTGAGCAWTAVSNNLSFLTVTSGSSGTGNGTVNYSLASNVVTNTPTSTRVGTMTIAGLTFTVTEGGCSFGIAPTAETFGSTAGAGAVNIATPAACTWTVSGLPAWASTTSGGSGTGQGSWQYTVSTNGTLATRSQMVTVASLAPNFNLVQLASPLTPIVAGTRTTFNLTSATDVRWTSSELVGGRSYCAQVVANRTAVTRATPTLTALRADATTPLGASGIEICFAAPATETALFRLTQADASTRSYRLAVTETTLWANWFFVAGDYSSFTLLRSTGDAQINATITWRDASGAVATAGTLPNPFNVIINPGGTVFANARDHVDASTVTAGSVEVAYDNVPQGLVGSQTTLSGTTGLSFDTLMMSRIPR